MTMMAGKLWSTSSTRIGWQTARGISVRFSGILLGYSTTLVLAPILGAEQFGVYNTTLSVSAFLAALSALGADRNASRLIAQRDTDDTVTISTDIARAHAVAFVVLALISAMAACFMVTIRLTGADIAFVSILPGVALLLPLSILLILRQWTTLPLVGSSASIFPEQVLLPCLVLSAALGWKQWIGVPTAHIAVVLYASCGVIAWTIGMLDVRIRPLFRLAALHRPSITDLWATVRSGFPFFSAGAATVVMNRSTPLLVAALMGFAAAGQLAVASQLVAVVAMPLGIVNLTIMPKCSRFHGQGNRQAVEHVVRSGATLCLWLAIPLAISVMLFSTIVLHWLGPQFTPSIGLVGLLMLAPLTNACCGPNGSAMQMIGLEREYSRTLIVANIVQILAVSAACYTANLAAVAVAIVAVRVGWNLALLFVLRQRYGLLLLPYANPFRIARDTA